MNPPAFATALAQLSDLKSLALTTSTLSAQGALYISSVAASAIIWNLQDVCLASAVRLTLSRRQRESVTLGASKPVHGQVQCA